jgi:hypothetical protein
MKPPAMLEHPGGALLAQQPKPTEFREDPSFERRASEGVDHNGFQ